MTEPIITILEDGIVRIDVGTVYGFVSSMHLVDTKVRQMLQSEHTHNETDQ